METSKKLAWLSGVCFVAVLVYSMIVFGYSIRNDIMVDYTILVTLITVTGGAFGATCAFYYNKARTENTIKLQTSSLKTRYLILKDIGVLNEYRAQTELDNELSELEAIIDNELSISNQEITYNG